METSTFQAGAFWAMLTVQATGFGWQVDYLHSKVTIIVRKSKQTYERILPSTFLEQE